MTVIFSRDFIQRSDCCSIKPWICPHASGCCCCCCFGCGLLFLSMIVGGHLSSSASHLSAIPLFFYAHCNTWAGTPQKRILRCSAHQCMSLVWRITSFGLCRLILCVFTSSLALLWSSDLQFPVQVQVLHALVCFWFSALDVQHVSQFCALALDAACVCQALTFVRLGSDPKSHTQCVEGHCCDLDLACNWSMLYLSSCIKAALPENIISCFLRKDIYLQPGLIINP